MNNAFLFVEAGREETNGSLMDLMRLGFTVKEGAPAPAGKATRKGDCREGSGGGCYNTALGELLLSVPSIFKTSS